ncbi:ATPase AAA [Bifidobacterium castoris]|uniref:ATPase AAA n=1 Tax=Bifidobacterium castoris TaxID=2306972 RepID=A0A430F4G7_9BIFI|nr:ATPase AAA [Bifidobacterium castoris]
MTMSLMMSLSVLNEGIMSLCYPYGYSSHPEEADLISRLLDAGEGLEIEYKRCRDLPHDDTFETICSFANRQGAHSPGVAG